MHRVDYILKLARRFYSLVALGQHAIDWTELYGVVDDGVVDRLKELLDSIGYSSEREREDLLREAAELMRGINEFADESARSELQNLYANFMMLSQDTYDEPEYATEYAEQGSEEISVPEKMEQKLYEAHQYQKGKRREMRDVKKETLQRKLDMKYLKEHNPEEYKRRVEQMREIDRKYREKMRDDPEFRKRRRQIDTKSRQKKMETETAEEKEARRHRKREERKKRMQDPEYRAKMREKEREKKRKQRERKRLLEQQK